MNKPISKHALRRSLERVSAEGLVTFTEPIGTVVDRMWHDLEKANYNGARKKVATRTTTRTSARTTAARPAPAPDLP